MADDQHAVDQFSLPNQIARAEQRIARQRQIVEDLRRFKSEVHAARLLAIMEQTLFGLRQQEQESSNPPAPQPKVDAPSSSGDNAGSVH